MSVSYICRIAFDSNPFDASPTWTDVTSDLMNFHTRRGRQWELNRLESGTASLRLRNLHGDYWPNNTTGTYYPNVLPWKQINIKGIIDNSTWVSPTSYVDPDTVWTDEALSYDNDTGTKAYTNTTAKYIELHRAATWASKVRVLATKLFFSPPPVEVNPNIDIDVYYDAAWHNVFSGTITYGTWVEKTIGSTVSLTAVRIKSNDALDANNYLYLYEVQIESLSVYDLYTGFIESWQPTFIMKPIKAPVMDLNCSDGIKNLSQYNLNSTTGFSQEYSGARINNVLNSLGWPTTTRVIDTGQSQLQSTGPLANVNAMTHIFTVEDTELGIFYESPSGGMVFQDRHARLKSPYTTSQATFSDTPSDFGYTGIDLAYEDLRIYNDIRVTPLSGTTEQVATNTTSQDSYGPRTLERPSLLMVTNAEALAQAQYLLGRYKDPQLRCKVIEIRPNSAPDNLISRLFRLRSYQHGLRLNLHRQVWINSITLRESTTIGTFSIRRA